MKAVIVKILINVIKGWHNTYYDWPFGKRIIIELFPIDDDCPFIGPHIKYACDASRRRIRNLDLCGFGRSEEDFIFTMKAINKGEYDEKYDISPMIRFIAKEFQNFDYSSKLKNS